VEPELGVEDDAAAVERRLVRVVLKGSVTGHRCYEFYVKYFRNKTEKKIGDFDSEDYVQPCVVSKCER
jgi:hypothetical protein